MRISKSSKAEEEPLVRPDRIVVAKARPIKKIVTPLQYDPQGTVTVRGICFSVFDDLSHYCRNNQY